jgi:hypothetical protein
VPHLYWLFHVYTLVASEVVVCSTCRLTKTGCLYVRALHGTSKPKTKRRCLAPKPNATLDTAAAVQSTYYYIVYLLEPDGAQEAPAGSGYHTKGQDMTQRKPGTTAAAAIAHNTSPQQQNAKSCSLTVHTSGWPDTSQQFVCEPATSCHATESVSTQQPRLPLSPCS